MTEATVLYEPIPADRIAYITLNRPEKLNALNEEVYADFARAFEAFERDADVRVGILRGRGRAFCSGYDLSPSGEIQSFDARHPSALDDRDRLHHQHETWVRMWNSPKPVVAQVHGFMFAGGLIPPTFCDIVMVGEETVIGWPRLPIGGGWIGPMWSWFIGPRRAKEMSMRAGSRMTGRQAAEWGYANHAVPESQLESATREMAIEMARLPAVVLKAKKMAINRQFDLKGFQAAIAMGAEWDALVHTDPSVEKLRGWIRELGFKGAIARFESEGL